MNDVPVAESFGSRTPRDEEVWQALEHLSGAHGMRHVLELWPVYTRRIHWLRFLAHLRLFGMTIEMPGDIVEIGVGRGASLLTFGKLAEAFMPGDRSRKVWGFDSFKGLQNFKPEDGALDPTTGKHPGGWSAAAVQSEIKELIRIANLDGMIPGHERIKLVVGDAADSIPAFVRDHPGLRICLLHLDADLYEPTFVALRELWPLVIPGGVVVFDEYSLAPWEGETLAAEQYFLSIGYEPRWQKFSFSHQPGAYLRK